MQLGALTSDRHPWGGVRSTLISQDLERMSFSVRFWFLEHVPVSFRGAEQARANEMRRFICRLLFLLILRFFCAMFPSLSQIFLAAYWMIFMPNLKLFQHSKMLSKHIFMIISQLRLKVQSSCPEHKFWWKCKFSNLCPLRDKSASHHSENSSPGASALSHVTSNLKIQI